MCGVLMLIQKVEVHFFLLFLLFDLLLLLCTTTAATCGSSACRGTAASRWRSTTATAASTTAHLDQIVHALVADHLGHEHWPVTLDCATSRLDQIVHGLCGNLSTIIVQDQCCIGAEQLVLLLLGQICCGNRRHCRLLSGRVRKQTLEPCAFLE